MGNERYEGQSFYDILEVAPSAGVSEIYKAYQRAKLAYSPSSPALYTMFTPQEAQELLGLVEEAFQTLSHQTRRKEYDLKHGFLQEESVPTASIPAPTTPPTKAQSAYNNSTPAAATKPAKPDVKKGDEAWVGQVKIMKKKDEIPAGFARTKVGVYKIDLKIEEEIASYSECDGSFIKKIREYKGVPLEQMADELRVTRATVMALESNDLKALPVAVFVRGHVTQIARVLNIDERRLADTYMKFFKANKIG